MSGIDIDRDERGRVTLWLSNPARRNALSNVMVRQLCEAMAALAGDDTCRVVVLRGRDGVFCAGRDLHDLGELQKAPPAEVERMYDLMEEMNRAIYFSPRPVVAVVERYAYGIAAMLNDLALQAHSGLMSVTGEADRPPVRVGSAVIDLHGSMALVSAILAALFHRERTGQGQRVETSLLLSSAHLMNYFYSEYWIDGVVRKPMGTANHLSVPNQVFPTADGRVVIIAPSDSMWQRCARALDPATLDRPEYTTVRDRQTRRAEVIDAISAVTARLSSAEVFARLGKVKVNVAKVNTIGDAADDRQLAVSGGVTCFEYEGETVRAVASPFHLGATPAQVRSPPPKLGEHRSSILGELGIGAEEENSLRDDGAFG